jgi:hypothetical protein
VSRASRRVANRTVLRLRVNGRAVFARLQLDLLDELHVIRTDGTPIRPGPSDADDVWYDSDGVACAYSSTVGELHWMNLPGVATFCFSTTPGQVAAYPERSIPEHVVADNFLRAVMPMALHVRGWELLHASAVLAPAGVVALCAVAGTGKSTAAYGLSQSGYPLWADDVVAFDVRSDPIEATSLPFSLRLLPEAASFFGERRREHPPTPEGAEGARAPLAAVCVLERVEGEPGQVTIERSFGGDAFTAVLTHGYCFTLRNAERNRRMMKSYLELIDRVPVFRVRFAPGLEQLSGVLDAIKAALPEAPS